MEVEGLRQPSISTNLVGCIKGATDFWDMDLSLPMLFGLSGHAFLINIRDDLCPSGPYVWDDGWFWNLLERRGIVHLKTETLTRDDSTVRQREALENEIRRSLDRGDICMLRYLENQLISGYDDKKFKVLRSWELSSSNNETEVSSITYRTWEEALDKEGWASVTILTTRRRNNEDEQPLLEPILDTAREAFRTGCILYEDGKRYRKDDRYHIGRDAFEAWIRAVRGGRASSSHRGHRWNAAVWSECRSRAAEFCIELAERVASGAETNVDEDAARLCSDLAEQHQRTSDAIRHSMEKDLPPDQLEKAIADAAESEAKAARMMKRLVDVL